MLHVCDFGCAVEGEGKGRQGGREGGREEGGDMEGMGARK